MLYLFLHKWIDDDVHKPCSLGPALGDSRQTDIYEPLPTEAQPSCLTCFWKLSGAKYRFAGEMKFSPRVQFTVGWTVQGAEQNRSVIKINMPSEPIYTTQRTRHASLLTPLTSLSLSRSFSLSFARPPLLPQSFFMCNLSGPSCPRSRKSLSVGGATAPWWFSLREHSLPEQAWPRLHTD